MTRKARLWVGATLLAVLFLNYAITGIPLYNRKNYLQAKVKSIIVTNNSEDEYFLEIFRRERASIDKKIVMVNCVGLSLAIIIASWTIFGLIIYKRK